MNVGNIQSLYDTIGQNLAGYDYEENRLRTDHANRLRQLAAQRVAASKGISESLAGQGLAHSGVHNQQQVALNKQLNEQTAAADQNLADRLIGLARKKIQEETQFNINSLLPR